MTVKAKHKVNSYIRYDKTIPISAVSENVLSFLPLERLLENFRIVTDFKQSWLSDLHLDADLTFIYKGKDTKKMSAEKILRSKHFEAYVKEKAKPERKYLLYKPLAPPYTINPLYFLMNSPTIAHAYENKRYFRDEFADLIRMPDHAVRLLSELNKDTYELMTEAFGEFVIQEEESTGSRGTFIIHNYEEYLEAILELKLYATSRGVVISKKIQGRPVGVQGCITRYGSFASGIQNMVIGSKILTNTKIEGAASFSGGVVGSEYPDIVHHQVAEIVNIVAARLASHGYKGIFGVDMMITPDFEVYAIEINARMTAFTHIIADMQLQHDQIPFILLHLLELGGYDYEVTNLTALPSSLPEDDPVSYLIMNNKDRTNFKMTTYIKPGVYKIDNKKNVTYLRPGYSINDLRYMNEALVFSKYDVGSSISPGSRMYTATFRGDALGKKGLNSKAASLMRALNDHFGIQFEVDDY